MWGGSLHYNQKIYNIHIWMCESILMTTNEGAHRSGAGCYLAVYWMRVCVNNTCCNTGFIPLNVQADSWTSLWTLWSLTLGQVSPFEGSTSHHCVFTMTSVISEWSRGSDMMPDRQRETSMCCVTLPNDVCSNWQLCLVFRWCKLPSWWLTSYRSPPSLSVYLQAAPPST